MSGWSRYLLLILIVGLAVFLFYRVGDSALVANNSSTTNLSTMPTSTPRPQIFRFIQEAMKHRPKPTLPPDDAP